MKFAYFLAGHIPKEHHKTRVIRETRRWIDEHDELGVLLMVVNGSNGEAMSMLVPGLMELNALTAVKPLSLFSLKFGNATVSTLSFIKVIPLFLIVRFK